VGDKSIPQVVEMPIKNSYTFFEKLELSERDEFIGHEILKEIKERLKFLKDVGLDYITLERSSGSLSGGEAHEYVATQSGSKRGDCTFWMNPVSVFINDNNRLIETLKKLRILETPFCGGHDETPFYQQIM
jgi:excinuclease ABC subunit A